MEAIIYKIINDLNDKVYVGQTWKTAEERFKRHCAEARWHNTKVMPIVLAIKKYGAKHFKIIVLEKLNDSQAEIDAREVYWGCELNSLSPNGYNLKLGNARGIISEEVKRKISIGNKGKKVTQETIEKLKSSHLGHKMSDGAKKKLSLINTGKKLTEEHKNKIAKSATGKKYSDQSKEKMRSKKLKFIYKIVSPNGEVFETNNLEKFSREHNLNSGHMWSVAAGKKEHYKNWKVLEKRKDPSLIPKGIYCYDNDGICPYWDMHDDQPEQMNGYCAFLEEGDWESEGLSLLWDQVKECGENKDEEEE